jgi:hypothetical protein
MSLILILTIGQAVSSTLTRLGFYVGIRALPGARARQARWIIGSAVVAAAWLVGVFLLGAADVFRNDVLPPRIPTAPVATMLLGYLLLLSPAFRRIVAAVPQHWPSASRRSVPWEACGWSAISRASYLVSSRCRPASATSRRGCSRPSLPMRGIAARAMRAAPRFAWNLFGMADLANAVVLGALTGGGAGGIVFPIVLIPAYGVSRALLIPSYSLIGLPRKTPQQPRCAEFLHYGMDAARA